jgi:hypothetical protein
MPTTQAVSQYSSDEWIAPECTCTYSLVNLGRGPHTQFCIPQDAAAGIDPTAERKVEADAEHEIR